MLFKITRKKTKNVCKQNKPMPMRLLKPLNHLQKKIPLSFMTDQPAFTLGPFPYSTQAIHSQAGNVFIFINQSPQALILYPKILFLRSAMQVVQN